jgi:hypothetical protein
MNTPTPITEEHKALWTKLYNLAHDEIFDVASSGGPAHKLIADSEARATAELRDSLALEQDIGNAACDQLRGDADELRADVVRLTAERDQLRADLATERARLDACTILLACDGERVWHCGVNLRAAIDAGVKEGAK